MLEGLLADGSAEVSPTGLPSNKIPKPGGAGRKGRAGDFFATGLQSFMQKICSRQCPQTIDPQNGFKNEPKDAKAGSLGASWGHLWPTWVPKRLLERQVGAKMGPVEAKMGQEEVKLEPSWRQDASRRDPKVAKWRS